MNARPMTPSPAPTSNSGHKHTYWMPVKVCASCGQTTKALHPHCRRDRQGRLLVVDERAA